MKPVDALRTELEDVYSRFSSLPPHLHTHDAALRAMEKAVASFERYELEPTDRHLACIAETSLNTARYRVADAEEEWTRRTPKPPAA